MNQALLNNMTTGEVIHFFSNDKDLTVREDLLLQHLKSCVAETQDITDLEAIEFLNSVQTDIQRFINEKV